MIKNVILSTLAIAVLAGCSGKKDSDKDTSVVEAIPVKSSKTGKRKHCPYPGLHSKFTGRRTSVLCTCSYRTY